LIPVLRMFGGLVCRVYMHPALRAWCSGFAAGLRIVQLQNCRMLKSQV
jgi:hypothetical protein